MFFAILLTGYTLVSLPVSVHKVLVSTIETNEWGRVANLQMPLLLVRFVQLLRFVLPSHLLKEGQLLSHNVSIHQPATYILREIVQYLQL